MPMMNDSMPMKDSMPMDMEEKGETTPDNESDEKSSVFLSKADLGDHNCKVGDIITMKVTDIDQETGDIQAEIQDYGDEKQGGAMDEFDKAMPADKESY